MLSGCIPDADFSLLNFYMSGEYGGMESEIAAEFSRRIVLESQSADFTKIYASNPNVTPQMRSV